VPPHGKNEAAVDFDSLVFERPWMVIRESRSWYVGENEGYKPTSEKVAE
jgi:hypothetical protein